MQVKSVAVLLGSYGREMYAEPDPYWYAEDWHAAARGDGRSYGGVLCTIRPEPGENQQDVLGRAERWARDYNEKQEG